MQHTLRRLIRLLLLLALVSGGQAPAVMAVAASNETAAHMPMDCPACDDMDMQLVQCDSACIVLPAIEAVAPRIVAVGSQQCWSLEPSSGPTHCLPPDPSPPRS